MSRTNNSNYCKYHKSVHDDLDKPDTHQRCIDHGHCMNPTSCPRFKSCPMHKDGANMFLAWDRIPASYYGLK